MQLFNLLKAKLEEALMGYVKSSSTKEIKQDIQNLATPEVVKDEINQVRLELKEFKSEIIKWMFVFWIGLILTTLNALFGLVKFFIT